MNKSTSLKEIQNRLPEKISIYDETTFEFTDDEFVGILCWIKYFNGHFKEYGMETLPKIVFPIISKRLRLDFGLYNIPSEETGDKRGHYIYISANGKSLNGKVKQRITIKEILNTWKL